MMNWMTKIVSEFTLDDCKTKEEVMEVRIENREERDSISYSRRPKLPTKKRDNRFCVVSP